MIISYFLREKNKNIIKNRNITLISFKATEFGLKPINNRRKEQWIHTPAYN